MTGIIIFFVISIIALSIALIIILADKRYKSTKARYVDVFIRQHDIEVTNMFVGSYFDLVHDAKSKTIWFFHLKKKTLQFKEIPYEDLHEVKWEIDGVIIRSMTSERPLKRDLLTKERNSKQDVFREVNEQYRVKEAILSIVLDELEPQIFDLRFISVNRPISFKQVKESEIATWYDLFVSIIEANDAGESLAENE